MLRRESYIRRVSAVLVLGAVELLLSTVRAGEADQPRTETRAGALPDAAHAERPRRRWAVSGASFEPALVDTARHRTFLFDAKKHAPFAIRTDTGQRLWTGAAVPPDIDAQVADRPASSWVDRGIIDLLDPVDRRRVANEHLDKGYAVLKLGEGVLLLQQGRVLVAYDADSGRQLWKRPEECWLAEARGLFARLDCPTTKSSLVIDLRSDRPVLRAAFSPLDDTLLLGHHTLLRISKKDGALSGQSLTGKGAPWSIALPEDAPRERSGGYIVTDTTIVIAGPREATAIDVPTGRALWHAPTASCAVQAGVRGFIGLLCRDHIRLLEPTSGTERSRIALPLVRGEHDGLTLQGDADHLELIEDGRRFDAEKRIFSWTRLRRTWSTLRGPSLVTDFVRDGNTLLAATPYERFVLGLDLASPLPALTSLPPEDAVAAILEEAKPSDVSLSKALLAVPGLGPALARRLDKPADPLYGEALAYVEQNPLPEALPALIRRLPAATTWGERHAILNAIAAQDGDTATHALLDWLKDAPERHNLLLDEPRAPLHEHLWRTGRSDRAGLCVAGTRPLPALTPSDPRAEIGTAHPLIFTDIASDGSWIGVCQARDDTDHDGKIEVITGHHGEVLGDLMRPYLIVGAGPGLAVDEFLGHDPTGRYVAVRQGACLDLIDTRLRTATRLPSADLRDPDPHYGRPRAVSFDAAGQHMLYIKGGVPTGQLVVRELTGATETTLDPGPENLWHVTLDPEGQWVMTESLLDRHWPAVWTTVPSRICQASPMSDSRFGGPTPASMIRRVIPAAGGPAKEISGVIRPFGRDLLVRAPDGALIVASGVGQPKQTLVPQDCHAIVEHADGHRGLVVAQCTRGNQRTIELFGGGKVVELRTYQGESAALVDHWDHDRPRFALVGEELIVDLDRWTLVQQPSLGPHEARRINSYDRGRDQPFAVRGDGFELAPAASRRPHYWKVAKGPLHWRPQIPNR